MPKRNDSRKRTPRDDSENPAPAQRLLQTRYKSRYEQRHPALYCNNALWQLTRAYVLQLSGVGVLTGKPYALATHPRIRVATHRIANQYSGNLGTGNSPAHTCCNASSGSMS